MCYTVIMFTRRALDSRYKGRTLVTEYDTHQIRHWHMLRILIVIAFCYDASWRSFVLLLEILCQLIGASFLVVYAVQDSLLQ